MGFRFSDQHIEEYYRLGFTVFRGIIPTTLLTDLRRVAEPARQIARAQKGPQTQRLQPIGAYELDQKPFLEYQNLPALHDAIQRVLCLPFRHEDLKGTLGLGMLLEPADLPWCTAWHRDWRDHVAAELRSFVEQHYEGHFDRTLFNQINCPLYADDSTWVVPGSHLRADLPGEVAAFSEQPPRRPQLEGLNNEERERACLEYCRSMPGAECLHLDAGDFALYRNILWHIGNYVPYRKRVTLHDIVETPEYAAWRIEIAQMRAAVRDRQTPVLA